jgi:hypothetical protein
LPMVSQQPLCSLQYLGLLRAFSPSGWLAQPTLLLPVLCLKGRSVPANSSTAVIPCEKTVRKGQFVRHQNATVDVCSKLEASKGELE